jgi:TPR repeat protein
MLEDGRGEPVNLRKAFHWYEKAAEQGEWAAQYDIQGRPYEAARCCLLGRAIQLVFGIFKL